MCGFASAWTPKNNRILLKVAKNPGLGLCAMLGLEAYLYKFI